MKPLKYHILSLFLSPVTRHLSVVTFLLFTFHFSLLTSDAEEIKSRAALVMEASTGRILFAKNPNLRLPPASTTKLVTAMVVLDRTELNDMVTISEGSAKVPSVKWSKFKAGETATVETLLYAALLSSVNCAAVALAKSVAGSEKEFVRLMNKKAIAIGASNTRFINTTGLPGRGQRITAYDLAKIMRHALKYPVIREIIGTKTKEISTEEGRAIPLENTNRLLWSGNGDNGAVGGKTGYTKAARHCFVYAEERGGKTVIVAILGALKRDVLWDEAERLVERGFKVIANNEQPVVYFTKADYTKTSKLKVKSSKLKVTKAPLKKKSKGMQVKENNSKGSAKESKRTNPSPSP